MKTFILFSTALALLLTAYLPLTYSWVVFDSRNDMLAMSSETDDVAVRVPADSSSSEEVKKDNLEPTKIKGEEGAVDEENKSETEEADSNEQQDKKFKETKAEPQAMDENEAEDDEATEPALVENENEIAEDNANKGSANETTTENVH